MTEKKDKLKILFLEPETGSRYNYIPMGLAYLSSYVKKHSTIPIETKIVLHTENEIEKILAYDCDIIGITAMTHNYSSANKIADKIKAINPKQNIILGGQHITSAPDSLHPAYNCAIAGEGEAAFLQYVNAFIESENIDYSQINNLVYWDNGKIRINPRLPFIEPIDSISYPDREATVGYEEIISSNNFGRFNRNYIRWIQITTSRGCPYKCKFCQPSVLWGKYRMHSAEYVADEIEYVVNKYNINAIQVEDDLFTGNKTRLIKIIELLGEKNLLGKVIFNVAARAEQINDEWVELFKKIGIVKVELGIESGSDSVAEYLKNSKKTTQTINLNAIELLNKNNIAVFGSFIAGAPIEEYSDLIQTKKFMLKIKKMHKNNECSIGLATPLPGTELWDYAVEKGLINLQNFDWNRLATLAGIPKDLSIPVYLNENVPIGKTIQVMKSINRRMWLGSPLDFLKAIPRRIKKIPAKIRRILKKLLILRIMKI
jgi:magnesium-protoporphyrin IX monomethyl ester (oxidative) cyclase